MTTQQAQLSTVLVIDRDATQAAALKDMIEFFDTPIVTVAGIDEWEQLASQHDVSAVFLGHSLSQEETTRISDTLRQRLPSVPVVIVDQEDGNG